MSNYNILGEYNYYAYTKIDTYSSESDFLISAAAVHEFVHSILTKGSTYGSYVTLLFHGNKNNKNHLQYVEKEKVEKQQIKNGRNDKILYSLIDNMIKMQETTATLVELLYVSAKSESVEKKRYMRNLGESYHNYIKPYKYILNEKYISDYEMIYMNWLKETNVNEYNKLNQIDSSYRKFNLIIRILIESALMALNIKTIDSKSRNWEYPNALINTILCEEKNHPSKRFDNLMKSVFKPIEEIDKKNPFSYVELDTYTLSHQEVKNDLFDKTFKQFESKYIQERNGNLLSDVRYVKGISWDSIESLESNAILTGIPRILSENSSEKILKGYLNPFKESEFNKVYIEKISIQNSSRESYIDFTRSKTVYLQVVPSGSNKEKYEYEFHIEKYIIRNKELKIEHIRYIVLGRDLALNVLKEVESTNLVLLGIDRDPEMMNEKIVEKFNRVFIYPCTNVLSFINVIDNNFPNSTIHIMKDEYFHMMYIRNKKKILFQPIITRIDSYLKQASNIENRIFEINGDLPFRKTDKKLIDTILYKNALEESHYYNKLNNKFKENLY